VLAQVTQADVDELAAYVVERLGVRVRPERAGAAEVLVAAMDESGAGSWRELRTRLEAPGGQAALERIAGELTIKETYLFRTPPHFEALLHRVLPEVSSAERSVRVWSAGCATGEETYSVAATCLEHTTSTGAPAPRVLGTDISERALLSAREGVFRLDRRAAIPEELGHVRDRFLPSDGETRSATPLVHSCVSFCLHNLLGDPTPLGFDVVFCRNVMIHLPLDVQPRLVARLFEALRPGGWLFCGDAELLHVMPHRFETVLLDGGVAYRRPDGRR
jgi:chemotaxis protein methyltransferase CheR